MFLTHKNNHTLLYSLETIILILSKIVASNWLTKVVEVKEVSLYNNGGGDYVPSNNGKRTYPLE